jgi:hypothetical protein
MQAISKGALSTEGTPRITGHVVVAILDSDSQSHRLTSTAEIELQASLTSYVIWSIDKEEAPRVSGVGSCYLVEELGVVKINNGNSLFLYVEGCDAGVRCEHDMETGIYRVLLRAYRYHDVITGNDELDVVEVVVAGPDVATGGLLDIPLQPEDGFVIRSDYMGFVLFTEQFVKKILEYAEPGQTPLEFLTSDTRADELTASGLCMPFLGIRMWPYRVQWRLGPIAIPAGLETGPSVHLKLATNTDGTVFVCPGGALEDVDALTGSTWPRYPVPAQGVLRIQTYVTGGELTTFVLSPAAEEVELDEPIINVDPFSEWHEVVSRLGSEDEEFGMM